MTLGSLFGGLGGWQLAAIRAGIKPLWSSEINTFCRQITARHFPATIQLGDINSIGDAPHVDIITASSPCQDEWRAIRQAGKRGNKQMCATIQRVIIPLARAAGSTTPDDKFYMTYQKAVNEAAHIKSKSRDALPLGQLYEVEKLQSIVDVSIRGKAAQGATSYKQIYRDTKQTLENYSRLSLISERFLPA